MDVRKRPVINTTVSEENFKRLDELTEITRRKKSSIIEEAIEIMWDKYKNK